jgi:hypothetical protein
MFGAMNLFSIMNLFPKQDALSDRNESERSISMRSLLDLKRSDKGEVRSLIEKSDAMKQHEKWIEETMKHKPKHTREGLPVEPLHVLFFLGALFVLMVVVGSLIHH